MNPPPPLCWKDIAGAPADGTVLARLDEIADGSACLLSLGQPEQPFQIIVLRSGARALAYVNRCMHFGVPLASRVEHLGIQPHQSIRCSVHYARYRWHDGLCEWGDCEGESLLAIPVAVVAGQVVVSDPSAGSR